jgi:pimeloyl-ACP methyl ester carboxylesterase
MRGQQNYKIKALIGMFFLIGMQFFAATSLASADSTLSTNASSTQAQTACQKFQTNENYFFDDYETYDYSNGFLALHFKLKQPYNDGRSWTDYGFNIYDQSCTKEFHDAVKPRVVIDPGVQLYSVRFSSATHYDFWDDETDVREQCAACSGDISTMFTTTGGQATSIGFYGRIDGYGSWIQSDSFTILPPAPLKTPVLIIPGILGTELSYVGQNLWPNLVLSAVSDDSFMDPLQMDISGQPIETITVGGVVSSINYAVGTFDYTDGLVAALTKQGYVEGSTLFLFPYDWRTDPADTIAALKTELDMIAKLNPNNPKIDIVAHSYGGLLLKRYIQSSSDKRIGKIIFVGVPQLGTAEAAQALLFGSDLGVPILNSQEVFKLAQNMPMIYDLLPSAEYYKHAAGFFDDLSNITTPQIPGYYSDQATLTSIGKNLRLLNQAALSHTDALDNMDFSTLPYQVSSIVGCGVFTEKTINKMYNGDPTILERAAEGPKYRIQGDSGDGTVLMQSAVHDGGTVYYATGISHSQLLSDPITSAGIINLLNGVAPDPTSIHTADSVGTSCNVSGKIVSFSSNVNVVLKNRTTGTTMVPQRDYNVIQTGNDRHIFIPTADLPLYSIQIQNDVAGGTPENISVSNSSTSANDNHNTYNYNNQKLDTNLLAITFPTQTASDAGSGEDVENVDPTTGATAPVSPSSELDGSYTTVPGTTASDTVSDPTTVTSAAPTSDVTQPSQASTTTAPDTSDDVTSPDIGTDSGSGNGILDSQGSPEPDNSETAPEDDSPPPANTNDTTSDHGDVSNSDSTQTETLHTPTGETITININNAPAAAAPSVPASPAEHDDPLPSTMRLCVRMLYDMHKIFFGILF